MEELKCEKQKQQLLLVCARVRACVRACFPGLLCQQNMRENPIHIINVSIQSADTEDDDALVSELTAYTTHQNMFCCLGSLHLTWLSV